MSLARFAAAQADSQAGFEVALRELQSGEKRSHWIWYIFPQLGGLGSSAMATRYGLRGVDEAVAYFRDPLLRERLRLATRAVASHVRARPSRSLAALMGGQVDARKMVSSLTLFREIARRQGEADPSVDNSHLQADVDLILAAAAGQGLPECAFTRAAIARDAAQRANG